MAADHSGGEVLVGEGGDAERGQGPAPHGVDVRERVGGGDLAEGEGVVDHRGEEVHGLDEGGGRVQTEDPRVVARGEVHEHAGVAARL